MPEISLNILKTYFQDFEWQSKQNCFLLHQKERPAREKAVLFSPRKNLYVLACMKTSRLELKDTVYSYGQFYLTPNTKEEDIQKIKAYLASGFHPDKRPRFLKRTSPFNVPLDSL